MNHFRASFSLLCILFLSAGPASAAQHSDMTGRWGVGLQVAGAIPSDETSEAATYVGGTVTYGVIDHVVVGIEAGAMSFDEEESGVDFGDLDGVPVFAIVQARYPFMSGGESRSTVYGTLGLGVIFWDFEESTLLTNARIRLEADDAFAVKLGTGMDFFIGDHVVANVEAAYVFSDTEAHLTAAGMSLTETAKTDYWLIGGGIKYLI